MRVLVCGGRCFDNKKFVFGMLDALDTALHIDTIIEGGAGGADTLAAEWAKSTNTDLETFNADWTKHGRAAGPIRNARMLKVGHPDIVLAFPGSNGTKNMCTQAEKAGVEIIEPILRKGELTLPQFLR